MTPQRLGLLAGFGAYLLWGLLPLYWPLLEPAGAVEILAHRIAWSLVFVVALLALTSGFGWLRTVGRRRAGMLALAAVLVSANWGTYIYGVNHERVVETSLGYFINPLVTVLLAVVVLREHLRPRQWVGIGIAAVAVAVLTADYGHPPWIALVLAFSFGTYGLAKKQAGAEAVESLTLETLLVAPLALCYLAWLVAHNQSTFGTEGTGHALLLMSAGLVTALPLLCFGAAAIRVPLVTLGLLQYLAPVLQFLLGVLWFQEDMSTGRWVGFALVWVALAIFTFESVRNRRRQLRVAAEAVAV